jgi:glutamate--cysteine ligase
MTRLNRPTLLAYLEERTFSAPGVGAPNSRRIGAEVELIPIDAVTGRPCPLDDGAGPATLPFLRRFASRQGWVEQRTPKGVPCFAVPTGGSITFEPGGQIEFASPPSRSASTLINRLRGVVLPLRAAAAAEGITLLTVGIDPRNPVEQVPLQLSCDRYVRMAAHFARIGQSGARMMRQTAAFQVSVDFENQPFRAMATAECAHAIRNGDFCQLPGLRGPIHSAPELSGSIAGDCSIHSGPVLPYDEERPSRGVSGVRARCSGNSAADVDGRCDSFDSWLARANPSARRVGSSPHHAVSRGPPRAQHLELRSMDAIDPAWYPAALAIAGGAGVRAAAPGRQRWICFRLPTLACSSAPGALD